MSKSFFFKVNYFKIVDIILPFVRQCGEKTEVPPSWKSKLIWQRGFPYWAPARVWNTRPNTCWQSTNKSVRIPAVCIVYIVYAWLLCSLMHMFSCYFLTCKYHLSHFSLFSPAFAKSPKRETHCFLYGIFLGIPRIHSKSLRNSLRRPLSPQFPEYI